MSGQPATASVERTISRGNAGNQIKVAATATVVNSLLIGNCAFFDGKSFAQEMEDGDQCRALGNALALSPHHGDQVAVVNATIVGQGDCLMEAECDTLDCDGSESVDIENSVFGGYTDWRQPWENTCYMWYDADVGTVETNDYNVVYDVKDNNGDCATGPNNICDSDPLFSNPSLDSFDGHLQVGSPAIDNGLPVGSLGGLVPGEDLDGVTRPVGSGVDRGAYEYRESMIDVIIGLGPGMTNPNTVRVITPACAATGVYFTAYGAGAWGVNVASGNVDGGTYDEILTGPGPGAVFGPQVKAFVRDGTAISKINFYAYGTLKYGVKTASGRVDGDSYDEILTGPGPGAVFGPHVRGWNYDGTALSAIAKINFFAYSTLKYGVNVSSGDYEDDAFDEILTGPGPGAIFGPQVRGWNYDGSTLTAIGKINFMAFSGYFYGVNVAGGDVDANSYSDFVCAPGPGPSNPANYRGFYYNGCCIAVLPGFDITPFPTYYGGRLGLGDLQADGRDELMATPGSDPTAIFMIRFFRYDGSTLSMTGECSGGSSPYGVNVAGGELGY